MYQGKLRKIMIVLLTLYTALILYFLYLGFSRGLMVDNPGGVRFNLIPEGIALHYPMGQDFQVWFFEYGNFLAFIPFGIIIPLLFRCSFRRFITFFILSITILETLQMVSRLGAFDIDDIIINSLGAAVGFAAQRLVTVDRDKLKGIFKMSLIASILALGTIIIIGGINHYLEKGAGDTIALDKLPLKDGSVEWDKSLSSFKISQEKVTPQINLYSTKNNEFSYHLGGKYKNMTGYVAIPGDAINDANTPGTKIGFYSGGELIGSSWLSVSAYSEGLRKIFFNIPLIGVNDLTIKIINHNSNPNTNAMMWDVTLIEPNTGQKIINSIKEKIR
ncbi:VanZ family protein [Neobacillus massiliamazoniensis]|uniref:Antibiotic resistance protein n=1 Tax=Neobacillus massiliamazoniensis TaxID=1499688 RepID=A0A0U1NSY5_9BACI|nr:VanZ family protein [Neobacillus massiliamazoniensis]CRK81169.1 antibiotic resistance protein [Neobacillus massiliamazoniensis]